MAEALFSVMFENLNSLIQKEFGLLWGINEEMESLSSILSTICAVLQDAEERQIRDRAIKNWLQKLKDVAEELHDILCECSMEASQLEYKGQRFGSTQQVTASFLSCLNPKNTLSRYRIAKRMKDVSDKLDKISKERTNFHLREVVEDRRHVQVSNKPETDSFVDEKHVYGREKDKDKIVEFLVDNSRNSNDLLIYPIVGIGGTGKTTLAKLVFNDVRVSEHFETKLWICVSEDFDVKRLIKAIIESATEKVCEALDMDPLKRCLQSILERKKFFLVLDDVWSEHQDHWESLRNVLACGLNGSSILVTTRLKNVARIMGTIPMHELFGLLEDDCWSVFKHRAFGNESEERPSLVKIGKEIVRKCKGNPLAAKTLGSLLRSESEEKEWVSVKESELWNLPQDDTSILPALKLSYLHLPIELRRCFAFCAMFPKDYLIVKETLIHLWIANDFISSKGNMEVEEIGNKICKELYSRSFFQDAIDEGLGCFKMHDLVHDLAQSIMEDECRVIENYRPVNLSERIRHLTWSYSDPPFDVVSALCKAESLRTLMLLSSVKKIIAHKFLHGLYFRSLRAFVAVEWFELTSIELSCLSTLIVSSKHLRYLNLSDTKIRFLPESICSLQSLQTLDVSGCLGLAKLPKHMSRIRSLRHFYIEGCRSLNHMPPNIGKLSCLRSLCKFIVDRRRGCDIDELGSLFNLGGSLRIEDLEKVKSPTEAKKANLARKMNLKRLTLEWGLNDSTEPYKEKTAQVLEALEPPPGLEVLRIDNFRGMRFPRWFSNNDAIFQNLDGIEFFDCKNCSELPTGLGKLPSLTYLGMYRMDCLRCVDNESESFGTGDLEGAGYLQLQKLRISCLPSLERLSRSRMERRDIFPRLSSLNIEGCPKLTSLHCLQSIRKLSIRGCSETVLESVSNLHTLTSLEIWNNDDLASFPDGFLHNLTALKSLKISGFTKLQYLQSDMLVGQTALEKLSISSCYTLECFSTGIFRGLISLKEIRIENCRKLKSLSDSFGDLTALESMEMRLCEELETFPNGLNNLSSLQHLILKGSRMAALPENLQHLPALKHMLISGFPYLEKLPDWLGGMTSLSSLYIMFCPNLEYLPISVQRLTNLQSLDITNCLKLVERCKKGIGEDWHKIAHVPRIDVR